LLRGIQSTATETTARPDRTSYVITCADGTTLQYDHCNGNEGVLVGGYMVRPDGTTSTPDVNRVIRHAVMLKPYQQQINANPCYVDAGMSNVRPIPVIDYAQPWRYWLTANRKMMYIDSVGADVYILRATAICLPDMGVDSPIVSVAVKIKTYL